MAVFFDRIMKKHLCSYKKAAIVFLLSCVLLILIVRSGSKRKDHLIKDTLYPAPVSVDIPRNIFASVVEKRCDIQCQPNTHAVLLQTGSSTVPPLICVDGFYYIGKRIEDGFTGISIVILSRGRVTRVERFSSDLRDGNRLALFLENLDDGDIVLAVKAGNGVNLLSDVTRSLFRSLGSTQIQNMQIHDGWYFVGKKNLHGFAVHEKISFFNENAEGEKIQIVKDSFCLSKILSSNFTDNLNIVNPNNFLRAKFCQRYYGYDDFCSSDNSFASISPLPLINSSLIGNPIFDTPIIVITGFSPLLTRYCFESIVLQQGLSISRVYVYSNNHTTEFCELADTFNFQCRILNTSETDYTAFYHDAIKDAIDTVNSDTFIVLEENQVLSPDFLYSLALQYDSFIADDKICAINMWNPNSYKDMKGSAAQFYRTTDFFGIGYLMKTRCYIDAVLPFTSTCCSLGTYLPWTMNKRRYYDFIVPDVSRVQVKFQSAHQFERLVHLMNRDHAINQDPFPVLDLSAYQIEQYSSKISRAARRFVTSIKEICPDETLKTSFHQSTITIIFDTNKDLLKLAKCFGLYHNADSGPFGIWNGVLRFSKSGTDYYLMSKSHVF